MSLTVIVAPMANIHPNKYRDFNMAPIKEDKVKSLMGSIEKTDFWNNMNLRFKDNMLADGTKITSQEQIASLIANGHAFDGEQYEIPYGHQRLAALQRLEWSEVELPLKFIDDETMLRMMAEENKEGYGSDTGVKCETVKQVTNQINTDLQGYEDFDAYKAGGGKLFTNKKAFDAAKADGVGFRKVREFLGETWSESDIRGAFKVLKLVEAGYITQEDVGQVSSMGLLETVGAICEYLYEGGKDSDAPDMPDYWKGDIINRIIEMCTLDGKGWQKVTVKQLRRARTLLEKDGVNPAGFLKNGNAKTAFDFVKATKDLIFDPDKPEEVNNAAADELSNQEGFSNYPDITTLIEKVKKSIKASFARLAKGEDPDTPEEEETLDPTTEGDLQGALDATGAGEAPVIPEIFGASGEVSEEGGEVIPLPTSQLTQTYIQVAGQVCHGTELLLADVSAIGEDDTLNMSVEQLLRATIKLATARLERASIVTIFNEETK